MASRDKSVIIRTLEHPAPLRCKARVAIAGYRDVDLEQRLRTDAPTVTRLSTFLALTLYASLQMDPYSADVEAAFLQSDQTPRLAERIYLRQSREDSPGLDPKQLVVVLKPLFDFADSPRAWWRTSKSKLLDSILGTARGQVRFRQSKLDPALIFFAHSDSG